MMAQFQLVWTALGSIIAAIPLDVRSVAAFVFCSIGIVGILRSL